MYQTRSLLGGGDIAMWMFILHSDIGYLEKWTKQAVHINWLTLAQNLLASQVFIADLSMTKPPISQPYRTGLGHTLWSTITINITITAVYKNSLQNKSADTRPSAMELSILLTKRVQKGKWSPHKAEATCTFNCVIHDAPLTSQMSLYEAGQSASHSSGKPSDDAGWSRELQDYRPRWPWAAVEQCPQGVWACVHVCVLRLWQAHKQTNNVIPQCYIPVHWTTQLFLITNRGNEFCLSVNCFSSWQANKGWWFQRFSHLWLKIQTWLLDAKHRNMKEEVERGAEMILL